MKFRTACIQFFLCLALSTLASSFPPIITIFYEPGWKQTKTLSDGITVYRKPVPGSDLKAVMVTKTVTVQPATIIEVVKDVNHYHDFSPNSKYLIESRIVSEDSDGIVGYECLSVPLLQDRHYFFRLTEVRDSTKSNFARIDWSLIPPTEQLETYLKEHPSKAKDPMFLGDGAGSWECETIGEGRAVASYRLHLSFAGNVPNIAVDFGQKVGVIGFFRDVIQEAQRRESVRNAKSDSPKTGN